MTSTVKQIHKIYRLLKLLEFTTRRVEIMDDENISLNLQPSLRSKFSPKLRNANSVLFNHQKRPVDSATTAAHTFTKRAFCEA